MALVGALVLVIGERRRAAWVGLVAATLVLLRNDGALLACLLVALVSGWRRWLSVLLVIAATVAGWQARIYYYVGFNAINARAQVSQLAEYHHLFTGEAPASLTWQHWLGVYRDTGGVLVGAWLGLTLVFLLPVVAAGSYALRRHRLVAALSGGFIVYPVVLWLIAPHAALHGSIFRSMTFFIPILSVLTVAGLVALGAAVERARGISRWFVLGLGALLYLFLTVYAAYQQGGSSMAYQAYRACDHAASLPKDWVLWTESPVHLELGCQRPGIVLDRRTSASTVASLSSRFQACHAVIDAAEAPDALLGWSRVAPQVWRHPDWRPEERRCAP